MKGILSWIAKKQEPALHRQKMPGPITPSATRAPAEEGIDDGDDDSSDEGELPLSPKDKSVNRSDENDEEDDLFESLRAGRASVASPRPARPWKRLPTKGILLMVFFHCDVKVQDSMEDAYKKQSSMASRSFIDEMLEN